MNLNKRISKLVFIRIKKRKAYNQDKVREVERGAMYKGQKIKGPSKNGADIPHVAFNMFGCGML